AATAHAVSRGCDRPDTGGRNRDTTLRRHIPSDPLRIRAHIAAFQARDRDAVDTVEVYRLDQIA
ncbi:hypothetical protein NQV17_30570, partial [Burkholderia sp. SCN-KJ]|nr:hypothetical protein [Burkholderia sp. SCN-KJ]